MYVLTMTPEQILCKGSRACGVKESTTRLHSRHISFGALHAIWRLSDSNPSPGQCAFVLRVKENEDTTVAFHMPMGPTQLEILMHCFKDMAI